MVCVAPNGKSNWARCANVRRASGPSWNMLDLHPTALARRGSPPSDTAVPSGASRQRHFMAHRSKDSPGSRRQLRTGARSRVRFGRGGQGVEAARSGDHMKGGNTSRGLTRHGPWSRFKMSAADPSYYRGRVSSVSLRWSSATSATPPPGRSATRCRVRGRDAGMLG